MKKISILCIILSIHLSGNCQILKKPIPDRLVVLTFDDATESQYTVVTPLLKKFNFDATFFVCEFQSNNKDSLIYMNWNQIQELNKMGFEVANHTRTHPSVNQLPKTRFLEELNYIEGKCDSLDIEKPSSFAYPGYNLNSPVLKTLHEKGYTFARAGGSRAYDPLNDHPLLIPSWATNANNKKQIMEAFNEVRNGKIVVLTIHGVPDIEHPWVNTPPELFKEYLQFLFENKFTVISIRGLNCYINVNEAFKTIVPDLNKQLRN